MPIPCTNRNRRLSTAASSSASGDFCKVANPAGSESSRSRYGPAPLLPAYVLLACGPRTCGVFPEIPTSGFKRLLALLFFSQSGRLRLLKFSPMLQGQHPVRWCVNLSWGWGAIASNLESRRKIQLRSVCFFFFFKKQAVTLDEHFVF